jgi:hypothetical protein
MALEFIFSYGMLAILGAALVVSTVVQPLVGAGTVVIGVVVAAVGIPVAQKMLACGNTQVYRNHSWYRVQHFIHRLFVGERPLSWWDTIRATGLYGISSCLQLTFIVFLAESFVNLTLGQAVAVAGAWALSTCFGYFVFLAPAGIGVRDGLALALFSQVLDVPTAGLVVAASRVVMVATDLCFVAIIEALATSLRIKRKVFGPAIGIEAS